VSPSPPLWPAPPVPAQPFVVDIVDHASVWVWLAPVLAFAGTVLLFGGSMFALWRSNSAADKRERDKWRRDTLLRICTEVLDECLRAESAYKLAGKVDSGVLDINPPNSANTGKYFEVAVAMLSEDAGRDKLRPLMSQLQITGESALVSACDELRTAMSLAESSAVTLRNALDKYSQQQVAIFPGVPESMHLPLTHAMEKALLRDPAINYRNAAFAATTESLLSATMEKFTKAATESIS
jgi:hypothetical protein